MDGGVIKAHPHQRSKSRLQVLPLWRHRCPLQLCIYSFTSLLAPLALGYGPNSRRRNRRIQTEQPGTSEVDTQGPRVRCRTGAGQGERFAPAQSKAAAGVEAWPEGSQGAHPSWSCRGRWAHCSCPSPRVLSSHVMWLT